MIVKKRASSVMKLANDPAWALLRLPVVESMFQNDEVDDDDGEGDFAGMEEEAKQNTELFSSDLHK
jgi:hypothetical protein